MCSPITCFYQVFSGGAFVPGPLTFRMILRLVSSMNSTLTCVTPPREPAGKKVGQQRPPSMHSLQSMATVGSAISLPVRPRTLVTLTSLTGTLPAASILTSRKECMRGFGEDKGVGECALTLIECRCYCRVSRAAQEPQSVVGANLPRFSGG